MLIFSKYKGLCEVRTTRISLLAGHHHVPRAALQCARALVSHRLVAIYSEETHRMLGFDLEAKKLCHLFRDSLGLIPDLRSLPQKYGPCMMAAAENNFGVFTN
jgi:hypothetical protein